jgi:hypothetical protein
MPEQAERVGKPVATLPRQNEPCWSSLFSLAASLPEWVYDRYRFKGFLAVAVDGNKLRAGGEGFLALIDLASRRVEKLCDLRNGHIRVHGLQVDGNDLWVGAKNNPYRLPRFDRLANTRNPKPAL